MNRALILAILSLLFYQELVAQVSNNLDSLLAMEKSVSSGTEKVRLLRDIGFNYSKRDSEKALDYLKRAIALGEQINDTEYTVSSYSQIAMLYNNIGDVFNSDFYLEETRKKAETAAIDEYWASYYQAATLIYRKRKKMQEAVSFARKAVEYALKAGHKKENIAGAYLNLANTYAELGQYEAAVTDFYNALSLFDEIKNERGQAFCYNNLAEVQKTLGQYNESLKNTKRSLALKEKDKNKKGVASSQRLMAENYYYLRQPERALVYLNKSLAFFQAQKLSFDVVKIYQLKARVYHQLNDTLNAAKYYDWAIAEATTLAAPRLISNLEKEKAEYIQPSNVSESGKNRLKALQDLDGAKKRADTAAIMDNLNFLTAYAYQTGDYKKAYAYREEYLSLREKVSGPDLKKQLKKIESQYHLAKKENAIRLLEKDKQLDKAKLHQQKMALYASVGMILLTLLSVFLLFNRNRILQSNKRKKEIDTMRSTIASDLHDDIGSALSSIQIISSMAISQCNGNAQLKESVNRISELSDKVADGIREIVWSVNPEHDKLEEVVAQLRKLAAEVLGANGIGIRFTHKLTNRETVLTPGKRRELLMIFKEAINNARKYSGTERVDICIKQNDGMLSIHIKDHGCGFDKESVVLGNGLKNMSRRAATINAQLKIHSQIGKGAFLSLRVPLS